MAKCEDLSSDPIALVTPDEVACACDPGNGESGDRKRRRPGSTLAG